MAATRAVAFGSWRPKRSATAPAQSEVYRPIVKEGEVLFEIADFSRMWFVFDAYERDLAWIRTGQMVEVTTPSVPGKVFTAPVAFIDPNLAMETRTAKVRVILDNPLVPDPGKHRRELLHKTFADGRIRERLAGMRTCGR